MPGCLGPRMSSKQLTVNRAVRITLLSAAILFRFLPGPPVAAGELYRTDFETYDSGAVDWVAGDDMWAGTDGWIGNSTGLGVHGIDQDIIAGGGLGRTAFLGFRQPASTFVYVARQIPYNPGAGDLPVVEVETLVGIQDSITKPTRDSFFVSIWNSAGDFLAGIRFANQTASYGLWRLDGTVDEEDTGVNFYRAQLHLLGLRVDLPNNRWSADLDGIPLFADAPFHAGAAAVNFGYVAYEWQLSALSPSGFGDNWMLVADLIVRSAGRGIVPFRFCGFERDGAGTSVCWPGEIGFHYQVEYSDDGAVWRSNLPNSFFPVLTGDQHLMFTDPAAAPSRFYRVVRREGW